MNIIKLSNNKLVANFSSPHHFIFEDGNILPAVSNDEAIRLSVDFIEQKVNNKGDVKLDFGLSTQVWDELRKWKSKWETGEVHIVYIPLPMLEALHKFEYDVVNSPFRSVRIEDRLKKEISIYKQCI